MKLFNLLRHTWLLAALSALSFATAIPAAEQHGHAAINPADVQWGPAPGFLPAGAEMALLDGDPASKGQLTLRLRFPADYEIPAHWHPTQENVTVLSGTLYAGLGDKLDRDRSVALEPGGYMAIPANKNHFVWTKDEVVVQVDMIGPFAIHYVDPTTDPRNQ